MTLVVQHAHAGNLYGGIETILTTLARTADAAPDVRHRFALCFEGRLADELRAAGAQVDLLGPTRISRPWTVARARRRLRALLADSVPGIAACHSTWSHAIFGRVFRAAGVRSTFWLHGPAGGHWLDSWARRTRPDLVLCNSRYTAATAPQLFPATRSVVLHYPVAPGPELAPAVRAALRTSLSVPEGTCVLLQVSRMERGKGHAVLLDALAALRDRGDWTCWIVGGAQRRSELAYERALRHRASALGLGSRVRFLGQRADVPQLMEAADVFCHPHTWSEAFGVVFVEAMLHRLPIVGSALGGPLEIVDPECGILVEPGRPHELAQALAQLLDDPQLRSRLGSRGPARARALCDPAGQQHKLAALLLDLAASPVSREVA